MVICRAHALLQDIPFKEANSVLAEEKRVYGYMQSDGSLVAPRKGCILYLQL